MAAIHCPKQIGLKNFIPILGLETNKKIIVNHSGVIDKNINLSQPRVGLNMGEKRLDLGFVSDIGLHDLQKSTTLGNGTLKFLRRIPVDPMTRGTTWGLRSYQDDPDATRWGGQNVFDVYTTFEGTALDGTRYRDW